MYDEALMELKICRRAPGISHLLFADDTLLFFKANTEQAIVVKEILDTYARCTGQLNPAKCSILFSKKGDENMQSQVKQILRVEISSFEPKYLGLPTPSRRMKKYRFQSIKERLSKRLEKISYWTLKKLTRSFLDTQRIFVPYLTPTSFFIPKTILLLT